MSTFALRIVRDIKAPTEQKLLLGIGYAIAALLSFWEYGNSNNTNSKPIEFDGFRKQAGLNSFTLTPKQWIEATGAIGLISKAGRYGGTYAQKDIAFEFASWISVEFKLYLIKEFQRLKEQECVQLGWDTRRNLAQVNYQIHTDAIKENLIPDMLTKQQINAVYASEADLLNMTLFGITAKQWRERKYAGVCKYPSVGVFGKFGTNECSLHCRGRTPIGAVA